MKYITLNGACAHYVMVSKFHWKPFWLATQRDPQNDWTAIQNRVNYDVFAQAILLLRSRQPCWPARIFAWQTVQELIHVDTERERERERETCCWKFHVYDWRFPGKLKKKRERERERERHVAKRFTCTTGDFQINSRKKFLMVNERFERFINSW